MIDDDEWPQPDWIDAVPQDARTKPSADVLQGSILFGQAQTPPTAMAISAAPTGPIAMLQGAGNLLIAPRRAGRHDGALVRSRLRPVGRRGPGLLRPPATAPASALPGADEARAHGDVPDTRASLGWLLRRAYSVGNSDMRVLLKHRPGPAAPGRRTAENPGLALVVAAGRRHPRGQPESQGHPAAEAVPRRGQAQRDVRRALQRVCRGPWRMSTP